MWNDNLKIGNKKRMYNSLIRKINKLNDSYSDVMSSEELANIRKIKINLTYNNNNGRNFNTH